MIQNLIWPKKKFFCWFIGENHQPRCHLHARTSHQPVAVPVPLDPLLPTLLPAMRGAIEVVGIWHNLTIKHGYFRYFLHLGSVLRVMIHDISWYIPHFCGYFHWHDFLSHRFCSQKSLDETLAHVRAAKKTWAEPFPNLVADWLSMLLSLYADPISNIFSCGYG